MSSNRRPSTFRSEDALRWTMRTFARSGVLGRLPKAASTAALTAADAVELGSMFQKTVAYMAIPPFVRGGYLLNARPRWYFLVPAGRPPARAPVSFGGRAGSCRCRLTLSDQKCAIS